MYESEFRQGGSEIKLVEPTLVSSHKVCGRNDNTCKGNQPQEDVEMSRAEGKTKATGKNKRVFKTASMQVEFDNKIRSIEENFGHRFDKLFQFAETMGKGSNNQNRESLPTYFAFSTF